MAINTTTTLQGGDWKEKLALILGVMRDISRLNDPQDVVRAYAEAMRHLRPVGRRISLSRRELQYPQFRVTRSTTWTEEINPWKDRDRLPLLTGGLLARLIYGNETVVIDDVTLEPNEPALEYLAGFRSLLAIPMFDQGESVNMVVLLEKEPAAFPSEQVPELVLRSNLFGRATGNLVVKEELRQAYQALDRELRVVGEIQRSLLPAELPKIPTLDLAAFYQPSQRAGGDYYDFFELPDNQWGIFVADVSGHGTPAAVLMAVTHCIAHTHPGPPMAPAEVLEYLNKHLTASYTSQNGHFVTAFYGVYDPANRTLRYASAGHNPPRVKRCQDGSLLTLDRAGGLPLGIMMGGPYREHVQQLQTGDQIVFYTDGITEAHNPQGKMFGTSRLDRVLENCSLQASALLNAVLEAVEEFAAGRPADDDRTIIVARVV